MCAYHGLHYDSSGQCTLVPAEGHDAKVSLKLRLSTFQATERYGLIWACLGSEPRFSLPDWNPLESSEYQVIELSTEWQTSAARHTENFLDIAHAAWIHADTFAPRDYPEIGKFDVQQTAEGLYYEIKTMFLAANTFEYKGAVEECLSEYTLTMPYSICLKVTSSLGVEYIFDVATPVSADRIRIFMLKARVTLIKTNRCPTGCNFRRLSTRKIEKLLRINIRRTCRWICHRNSISGPISSLSHTEENCQS